MLAYECQLVSTIVDVHGREDPEHPDEATIYSLEYVARPIPGTGLPPAKESPFTVDARVPNSVEGAWDLEELIETERVLRVARSVRNEIIQSSYLLPAEIPRGYRLLVPIRDTDETLVLSSATETEVRRRFDFPCEIERTTQS